MSDSISQRQCKVCHLYKPLTPVYFRASGVWFEHTCIECSNRKHRDKRRTALTKPQNRIDKDGYKMCAGCGERKPATSEHFHVRGKGLASRCKSCKNARNRSYSKTRRKQNAENARNWRMRNPEKVKAIARRHDPVKRRISIARYHNSDKGRLTSKLSEQRRRARSKGLPHDFTSSDWQRCLEYWNHCCAICGRSEGLWHSIVIEHWIPISDVRTDNPGTTATNIVPMCHAKKGSNGMAGCNNSKYSKEPEQWVIENYGRHKGAEIVKRIHDYFKWLQNQEPLI